MKDAEININMYRSKSGHGGRRSGRSESLFCNFPHRICMQDRYEGYEFCLDHILEDKSAPFKQCNFVSTKTGQKCQKAAPKADRKEGYCPAHARKAAQMRHKAALKAKPTDAVKDCLEDLDYYRPNSTKSVPEVPPSLAAKILDYGSESESEGDPLLLEQAWRGTTDSDAESVDSEQEDALKFAGVYTAEEAALITRDKLIRLQSLYINQFKRLQHVMREKRRSYLVALRQEREAFGIDFGVITDPKQKRKFREYQSARGFRRRKGKEALLYLKSRQRRIQATPDYQGKKVPLMLQCCYKPEDGDQCSGFSLPMAKFCKDHILLDPKQVLYTECSKGQGQCDKPSSLLSHDATCSLHMSLPPHITYKPYEPEPPPAPPPPPPPTVIPLPENILPPAPVLPSLLDSQIDQLLQFQPMFLEQQLQQHVYDASHYIGSFAPPDVDMPPNAAQKGDVPIDTRTPNHAPTASGGKILPQGPMQGTPNRMMAPSTIPMDTQDSARTTAESAKPQGKVLEVPLDAHSDIHVDVETDVDVLQDTAQPQPSPVQQTDGKVLGDVPGTQEHPKDCEDTLNSPVDMIIEEAKDSNPSSDAELGLSSQPVEAKDPSVEKEVDMERSLEKADTQPVSMSDPPPQESAEVLQDPLPSTEEEPIDEDTSSSSSSSSSSTIIAQRATGDHNYNQQPLELPETGDPIIDVT